MDQPHSPTSQPISDEEEDSEVSLIAQQLQTQKEEYETLFESIQSEEKKGDPTLEACLKERAELEAENDALARKIRDLKEEEQYLDQVLNSVTDLGKIIQDMKQKNADISSEIESRTAIWMLEDDEENSCRDCSDDDVDGDWDPEEGEDRKDKNEAVIIDFDEELSLVKQFDPSLDRNVTSVKNGTLEKLVSCLYFPYGHDIPNYVDTFLLTYRSFMTPKKLLESLISAYPSSGVEGGEGGGGAGEEEGDEHSQTRHRARISNFLRKWITSSFEDFIESDKELLGQYEMWLNSETFQGKENKGILQLLNSGLKKALEGQASIGRATFSEPPPTPIRPKKANFTILDLDPGELARQLTVVCFRLYSSIQSWEFLAQSWNKKDKEKTAPHITKLTSRFNLMSRWIGTQVVTELNMRRRAQILEFFVSVGEKFNELNNFHGIMEIISGLQSSGVFRLKKTWDLVSKRKVSTLGKLGSYLSRESSYKSYRETLHSRHPPLVPYIGVYLSDLTFLEEGNKDFLENGHVNFHKRIMISNVIKEIKQYQQMPYNIEEVDVIQNFVEDMMQTAKSENQLYEYSLKCEPRAPQPQKP